MRQSAWTLAVLACLAAFSGVTESRSLVKREANGIGVGVGIGHGHDHGHEHVYQDKAKVEAFYGVKNAILGFVFNKINHFIDSKTAWIDQLDHKNIAKNKAQGIYPPKDPVVSLSAVLSNAIGQKLQAAAPFVTLVTSKLTSGSSNPSSGHGHAGFNFGSLLGGGVGASAGVGAGGHAGATLSAGYGAV